MHRAFSELCPYCHRAAAFNRSLCPHFDKNTVTLFASAGRALYGLPSCGQGAVRTHYLLINNQSLILISFLSVVSRLLRNARKQPPCLFIFPTVKVLQEYGTDVPCIINTPVMCADQLKTFHAQGAIHAKRSIQVFYFAMLVL